MKKLKQFEKWFNEKWGWFFTNGMKKRFEDRYVPTGVTPKLNQIAMLCNSLRQRGIEINNSIKKESGKYKLRVKLYGQLMVVGSLYSREESEVERDINEILNILTVI